MFHVKHCSPISGLDAFAGKFLGIGQLLPPDINSTPFGLNRFPILPLLLQNRKISPASRTMMNIFTAAYFLF